MATNGYGQVFATFAYQNSRVIYTFHSDEASIERESQFWAATAGHVIRRNFMSLLADSLPFITGHIQHFTSLPHAFICICVFG